MTHSETSSPNKTNKTISGENEIFLYSFVQLLLSVALAAHLYSYQSDEDGFIACLMLSHG